MSQWRERTVEVPGLTLAAREWGDPASEHKVLALHGWLDNCATFVPLAPYLRDVHLVALDLPGHGRSPHRHANDTYHFIDWIPDVVAALDDLAWQRPTLMGHSMGGSIASITAGTVPDRIRGVVLLDGLAPFTSTAAESPKTLALYIKQRTRLLDKKRPPYPSREAAIARLLEVTTLTPEAATLLAERNTIATSEGVEWTYDQRLRRASPMRFTEEHNIAFLSAIAAPVLFVRPTNGIPVDAGAETRWTTAIKNLAWFRPEGSHHVHLEQAGRVGPAVADFLALL